jgi:hypothetical protein
LEVVKQRQERTAKAEESPAGVTIEQCREGYVRVTFAEKPAREILDALRGAGFWWKHGSWAGKADSLPESVSNLAKGEADADSNQSDASPAPQTSYSDSETEAEL